MPSQWVLKAISLLVALSLLALCACGEEVHTGVDKKPELPAERWVKVSRPEASAAHGYLEYVGALLANRKVKVSAELGGLIERLFFDKGDRVKEGMVLAEIGTSSARLQVKEATAAVAAARSGLEKLERGNRPQEIQIATSQVSAAEAALLEAEKNYQRIRQLHDINAVSNSSLDAAERQLTTAKAGLESARQQLVLALEGPRIEDIKAAQATLAKAEASLAQARDRLGKSVIKAPCEGVAAFREVEQGEIVLPGTPITEIVELGQMKIRISLSEKDLKTLSRQKEFPFTVDAIPSEEFICRLLFLSPKADPLSRAFPVELVVDRPDPRMADGMTARVRFPIPGGRQAFKVPSAWLTEQEGKMGVFVLKEGKAVFRPTALGAYYDNRVEVQTGLGDEDLVITNPAGIRNGDVVKVKTEE